MAKCWFAVHLCRSLGRKTRVFVIDLWRRCDSLLSAVRHVGGSAVMGLPSPSPLVTPLPKGEAFGLPEKLCGMPQQKASRALDNPRADVYNKDKERRCPHSGQLPSSDVTLENMTAGVWSLRAVIFLVIIFSNSVLPEVCPERHPVRSSMSH